MLVEYSGADGALVSQILEFISMHTDAAETLWKIADVKKNAPTKGRSLTKKQREQRITIPVASLQKARIHVDM